MGGRLVGGLGCFSLSLLCFIALVCSRLLCDACCGGCSCPCCFRGSRSAFAFALVRSHLSRFLLVGLVLAFVARFVGAGLLSPVFGSRLWRFVALALVCSRWRLLVVVAACGACSWWLPSVGVGCSVGAGCSCWLVVVGCLLGSLGLFGGSLPLVWSFMVGGCWLLAVRGCPRLPVVAARGGRGGRSLRGRFSRWKNLYFVNIFYDENT